MLNRNLLSQAVRYGILASAVSLLGAAPAFAQETPPTDEAQGATELETIQVTGSRIKRADIVGAMPVQVITREQLSASGDVSVADYMRDVTFNTSGSFRPQSGSSAQALADIGLRGLGSQRTLVLIDGRRAPKAPFIGQAADLNSIPLAAVERIEILTDGASAIYGSDAIGGVVNIITRKDFNGVEFNYGVGRPSIVGGDTEEGSVVFGGSSDRAQLLAGASFNKRGMVFTRDRPWGQTLGNSSFGNSFFNTGWAPGGILVPVPGGCTEPDFSIHPGNGRCVYNFNSVAADEAKLTTSAVFARGSYQINDDWSAYMATSVARVESFGRYAPVPGVVFVPASSPNNNTDLISTDGLKHDTYLYHRFAAAGNRDGLTDSNTYDINFGFQGRIADAVDVDFGVRQSEFKYYEIGRGYIVQSLANQAIADGSYNVQFPSQTPIAVLQGITATIARESTWVTQEAYAQANFDVFEMGGGVSGLAVGAEIRKEEYQDQYDSLSEAGVILGSAGNSAGGDRKINSLFAEWLLPFTSTFEINLAARYEDYSDYGNDLAPKIGFRWQPLDNLTFRGSYGEGFVAPTLDVVTQKTAFSADTVFDPRTCVSFGDFPTNRGGLTPLEWCTANGGQNGVQINAFREAASTLGSEQSKQFSVGGVWDATDWLNVTLDYWNIEVEDRIKFFGSQEIADINNGTDPDPMPGAPCSITRRADGSIDEIHNCFFNQGLIETSGVDLRLQTSFDLNDWGSIDNLFIVSYTDELVVDGGDDQVKTTGVPEVRAQLQTVYSFGDFGFNWNIRHIGENGDYSSQTLHDLQGTWSAPWNGKITVGVTNVEDEMPELIPVGGRNFNFNLYDAYGRTPYVRYTQSF